MKGESARATPSRANSSERARSGSVSACTLTRCRLGRPRLALRGAALVHGNDRGQRRRGKQRHDAGERQAQASLLAPGRRGARVEEGPLGRPQLVRVAGAPLASDREARAAIKIRSIAPALLPIGRRLRQVAVHAPTLRVGLEPPAQARPFAQQRLVGDLDRGGAQASAADGRRAAPGPPESLPRPQREARRA